MADFLAPAERSALMALIRGQGNASTELRLVAALRAAGIRGWRRGSRLPGRPDFAFAAARLAVFVDGCFWHGCPRHHRLPRTRRAFWRAKVLGNRRRDRRVDRALRARGWSVLRVWEHDLRAARLASTLRRLRRRLAAARPQSSLR
ncbi:MAG: very short patch repair endonuclease [Opitutia bacterium]|jgi:DNA mismatch endonuclease (patch repair protein)